MRALPVAASAGPALQRALPAFAAYRHAPRCSHQLLSRAAAAEAESASGEWTRLEDTPPAAAAAAAAHPPPPLDDDTLAAAAHPPLLLDDDGALAASAELRELCRQQLAMLTTALELSLRAVLATGSTDEDAVRQQLLLDSGVLAAAVYCRSPASLQSGQLQLQLVAAGGGGGSGAARAAQQRRFLFLGQDGAGGSSLADQEQWILEQPVIVLPDSGGLVLPLAAAGFLVGLLVVEHCLEAEGGGGAPGGASATAGAPPAAAAAGSGAPPPPPACLLFRSAELALLKQAAAVLALACAMDLRAAMERVGAAYRQRQASALVHEARKPLSVMRTLGTMLLPRLQPGEPDRDFAQGILEQGSRLQDVVTQLQAALHPSAALAALPPALLQPGGAAGRPRRALPRGGGAGAAAAQRRLPEPAAGRPALPSASIGSDFQWAEAGPTIDMSVDESSATASPSRPPTDGGGGSSSGSSGVHSSGVGALGSSGARGAGGGDGERGAAEGAPPRASAASADLLNVLMPLLASAASFAAVSGVRFTVAGPAPGVGAPPQPALPTAEVAVGPGKLKRMLSQLVDGVLACAARGDEVHASVALRRWEGRPGVAVSLACCYGLQHGGQGGLPRAPMQPEFAFLQSTAAAAGGCFEVRSDAAPDVAHLTSAALTAALWLPTVSCDAGWS